MKTEILMWAQKIASVLDRGCVGLANDMLAEMLKEHNLVKWELVAFGDVVRSFRRSYNVFVTVCEDKPVYRLEFHGKHIGYFEDEIALNRKISELLY
ncbi:hypothetical protein LAA48_004320 [Salmonella enterica subsp. enterica serovar Indiana]|nr:hypothetical protein [Salmonella enterica subsp. enterica serovar Indiana]